MADKWQEVNRREALGRFAGIAALHPTLQSMSGLNRKTSLAEATSSNGTVDEKYWTKVAGLYDMSRDPINLIAGANNPSPRQALEMLIEQQKFINPSPLALGRSPEVTEKKELIRERVSKLCHVEPDEIALTRGTTEGMNVVISGLQLSSGDEIVTTQNEYLAIKDALNQRAMRDGIEIKTIEWSPPIRDHDQLVAKFQKAITKKTKAVVICHIYDGYGQIMPVRRIAELAHQNGAVLAVDGAQGFANVQTNLVELDCDYYASSLHKWLGAPRGTGFLFVRRNLISPLIPLFGVPKPTSPDIRKFEDVGTTSAAPLLAASGALDLFDEIGTDRRFSRLQFLKGYWIDQLRGNDSFRFLLGRSNADSGGLMSFTIDGIDPRELWIYLYQEKRINIGVHPHLKDDHSVQCNYIAPNVFTLPQELDRVSAELLDIAKNGLQRK